MLQSSIQSGIKRVWGKLSWVNVVPMFFVQVYSCLQLCMYCGSASGQSNTTVQFGYNLLVSLQALLDPIGS